MQAKQATARRASTTRPTLSRDRIVRAALELADREGVDSLSMRRLANHLGAGTMTLYGHFANKEDLLNAALDAAAAEKDLPEFQGSWREQVHQLIAHARGLHQRHASAVEIWARQPVLGRVGLRWPEAGLRILEEAGFPEREAVVAFRLLVTYTYGFALFSRPRSGDGRAATQAALAQLPPDVFPRLHNAAHNFGDAMASEETFEYGLERVLDGLQARLESLRA